MAPTKAPWAEPAEDDLEELEGEDEDGIGELGAVSVHKISAEFG
jgi:hypothetical protein